MKVQKTKDAKASRRETTKANLSLGVDQYRRLFIASVMSKRSASAIIEDLIDTHLKEWAMPVNLIDRAAKSHRQSPVVCETDSAPAPPRQEAA